MKVLVRNAALKLVLPWAQRLLFAGAILLLGYCGFVLIDAWVFEHREQQNLEPQSQAERQKRGGQQAGSFTPSASELVPPANGPDGLIGRIEILRLGVSV